MLAGTLFQHPSTHPQRLAAFFEFDGVSLPANAFEDPHVASGPDVASALEFVASVLVVEEAFVEAGPVVVLLRYLTRDVCPSATLAARAALLQARALVGLGRMGEAMAVLFALARGEGLPGATAQVGSSVASRLQYEKEALGETGLESPLLEAALAEVPASVKAAFDAGEAFDAADEADDDAGGAVQDRVAMRERV